MEKDVFLIEDDIMSSRLISRFFNRHGYKVSCFTDIDSAMLRLNNLQPRCIILDLDLDYETPIKNISKIRLLSSSYLIVYSSFRRFDIETQAYEQGCDQYISKDRGLIPLIHTVNQISNGRENNNISSSNKTWLYSCGMTFDFVNRLIEYQGNVVSLTRIEARTLSVLTSRANTTLSRDMLTKNTTGREFDGISRSVDLTVSKIRNKIRSLGLTEELIVTVQSMGYQLKESCDLVEKPPQ
ncbi:response regulator transcription factor [Marinobacter hydrocarbonoclasticus]|nr:response regulator transcription factor [Marinobacter nauticus]